MLPNFARLALRPAGTAADDGGMRGPMPKIDPGNPPLEQLSHELVNVVYDNLLNGDDPDAICRNVKAFCATRKKEFGDAKLGAWCNEEMWKKACAALRVGDDEMASDFEGWTFKRTFLALCEGLHELTPEQRVAWFQGVGDVTRRKARFNSPANWEQEDKSLVNAARDGNVETVRQLIAEGADVNYRLVPQLVLPVPGTEPIVVNASVQTALFQAAMNGFFEIVKLLVENGADLNFPNAVSCPPPLLRVWQTPLSVACGRTLYGIFPSFEVFGRKRGSFEIASFLIDSGADVNQADEHVTTPLIKACLSGSSDIVAKLLQHSDTDASRAGWMGNTALHAACMSGSLESVLMLLKRPEVDINRANEERVKRTDDTFFTVRSRPLYIALVLQHTDIALALLDRDDIDVRPIAREPKSSLLATARRQGMRSVFERLIQRGAVERGKRA